MKRKISKEEYEKLSDVLKAEYELKGDSYLAKIEGDDDAITALRNAKDNESNAHKETKKLLSTLQEQLDNLTGEKNKRDGNIEALEKSWKDKLTARESELTAQINNLSNSAIHSAKEAITGPLAAKLSSKSSSLMKRVLDDRISVELVDGKPVTRILDLAGKPSAMSLEDLQKEIVANKEYAPIITVSRASGGASNPSNAAGGHTPSNGNDGKPVILSKMTPAQLTDYYKNNIKPADGE